MSSAESEPFLHKKSLGQHFLTSDYVPKKMCAAANLQPNDLVVEIGPGTGVLTKEILASGAQVLALETDKRAITVLEDVFAAEISSGQLRIIQHDARKIAPRDFDLVDQQYTVVANIPYYISSLLFRSFLETNVQPHTLVFLVQKEVAARIAREKKESLLSLSVKVFGQPTYVDTIKRGHFNPPPRVDSAIIAVNNISRDFFKEINQSLFFEVLHLGFGQKRKQLLSNLSQNYSRAQLEKTFILLGIRLDIRAEDMGLVDWQQLLIHLQSTPES